MVGGDHSSQQHGHSSQQHGHSSQQHGRSAPVVTGSGRTAHRGPAAWSRLARTWAIIALVALVLLFALIIDFLVSNAGYVLLGLLGLVVFTVAGWLVLASHGTRRLIGAAGSVIGIGLILAAVVGASSDGGQVLLRLVILAVLLGVLVGASRAAMLSSIRATTSVRSRRGPQPQHPVLICNPKSGGGKVVQHRLVELATSMGIETVLLEPGLDLEQLARRAVAHGADCLGMAGGDGSQALVASIAIEHQLPFVCISAGTRNHFALDLGLDREDPRSGMRAFRDAIERRVDYATVNGRLFVNNASLGVYATIVQQEGYREAKAATSAALLPELLGRADQPFDLQFTGPDGNEVDGSFLIQVSNNPYVLGPSLDMSQRRRLDSGELGVFAVVAASGAEASQAIARILAGRAGRALRSPHVFEFTTQSFEVRSRSGRAFIGVDGEALEMDTPLDFRLHPGGLRLLVPEGNAEEAARRQARGVDVQELVSQAFRRNRPAAGAR